MPPMPSVPVAEKVDRATFDNEIRPLNKPAVLKGLGESWPCVVAARESPQALASYLKAYDRGAPLNASICPAQFAGRYFYNAEMTGFNFHRAQLSLSQVVDLCLASGEGGNAYYVQAAEIDTAGPRMAGDLGVTLVDAGVRPRLWLGNSLTTQTHFDIPENIAVHVAGEKRFTLFPPSQVGNLYPGPIDMAPGGVPISMVQLDAPDFERYPRFREALDSASEAVLEPGDALYVPSLWWHHVSTRGPLNMLVNFWWNESRRDIYSPMSGLYMAALSFKHLPAAQREGWAALVNYFIFEQAGDPVAHLPAHLHSVFGAEVTERQMELFKEKFRRFVRL